MKLVFGYLTIVRIDAHQHFWNYDAVRDAWIDETMPEIRRDFLPHHLQPHLQTHHFDGCVAVQADQSELENNFLLHLAEQNPFIHGIVGWVDLCSPTLRDRLEFYRQHPLIKGFRHIAQAESDFFFLRDDVLQGIAQLSAFDFTYDILIYHHQLPAAIELVKKLPHQRFVVDHLAKPEIKSGVLSDWATRLKALASVDNVMIKFSGLVTEATRKTWRTSDFTPYLDIALSTFGVDRVMYGSDWPVCLLSASYDDQLSIIENYIQKLRRDEQEKIMGGNATRFYSLTPSNS